MTKPVARKLQLFAAFLSLGLALPQVPVHAAPVPADTVADFVKKVSSISKANLPKPVQDTLKQALEKMVKSGEKDYRALYEAVRKEYKERHKKGANPLWCNEIRTCAQKSANAATLLADLSAVAAKLKEAARQPSRAAAPIGAPGAAAATDPITKFLNDNEALIKDVAEKRHIATKDAQELIGQTLAEIKRQKGESFSSVLQAIANQGDKGIALVLEEEHKAKGNPAVAAGRVLKKLARKAGINQSDGGVIADAGETGAALTHQPTRAQTTETPKVEKAEAQNINDCEKNPKIVTCRLQLAIVRNQAYKNVAERLTVFLWDRDKNDPSFVAQNLRPEAQHERERVVPFIADWVQQDPKSAAQLYYVLEGSDLAKSPMPAWFQEFKNEYQAAFSGKSSNLRDELLEELKEYTQEGRRYGAGHSKGMDQPSDAGSPGALKPWIQQDFFPKAAGFSAKLLMDNGALGRINANAQHRDKAPGGPVVPGTRVGGSKIPGTGGPGDYAGGRIGVKDFFGEYGPGTKDVLCLYNGSACRYISVRYVTVNQPGNERLVPKIAIADISNAYDRPPVAKIKMFDLDVSGEQKIEWTFGDSGGSKDKKGKKDKDAGSNKEVLKFTIEDGKIVIKDVNDVQALSADDMDNQHNHQPIEGLTLGELADLRFQHAEKRGEKAVIGGQEYYVLPQSEKLGCFAFIPTNGGNINYEHLSCVSKPEGSLDRPISSPRHWGKGADGKEYKLVSKPNEGGACYGGICDHWEVAESDTEVPRDDDDYAEGPPPKPVEKPADAKNSDGNPAGKGKEKKDAKKDAKESGGSSKGDPCDNKAAGAYSGVHAHTSVSLGSGKACMLSFIADQKQQAANYFVLLLPGKDGKEPDKGIIFEGILACQGETCIKETDSEYLVRTVMVKPAGVDLPSMDITKLKGLAKYPLDQNTDVDVTGQEVYHISKDAIKEMEPGGTPPAASLAWYEETETPGTEKVMRFVFHPGDFVPKDEDDKRPDTSDNHLKRLLDGYDAYLAQSKESPIFEDTGNRKAVEDYLQRQLKLDALGSNGRAAYDEQEKKALWSPQLEVKVFKPNQQNLKVSPDIVSYSDNHPVLHDEKLKWEQCGGDAAPRLHSSKETCRR